MPEIRHDHCAVFSGGGVLGAWTLGALDAECQRNPDYNPGGLTGISIGSLHSGYMGQAGPDEFLTYLDCYKHIWFAIKNSRDIWSNTMLGPLRALFRPSIRKTDAMRRLLTRYADLDKLKASGRRVYIGAVDLCSGKYREGTEQDADIVDWMCASSAVPIFFPPVEMHGGLYVDGAIRETVALQTAFDRGYKKIDVYMTGPATDRYAMKFPHQFKNTIDVMTRSLELMLDEIGNGDLPPAPDGVEVRVVAPARKLIPDSFDGPLSFEPEVIRSLFELGRESKFIPYAEYIERRSQ